MYCDPLSWVKHHLYGDSLSLVILHLYGDPLSLVILHLYGDPLSLPRVISTGNSTVLTLSSQPHLALNARNI
jgi:hypothetical protein